MSTQEITEKDPTEEERPRAWRAVLAGRFPALRSRDFRLLWVGQGVSGVGSMMQFWAINWQMYALTHRPLALGLIGLFRVVPIVLFSLIGGAVADAGDRRKVMLVTQSVLAAVAAALGLLTATHHLTAAGIYALTVLGAAGVAFDNPARQSLIPRLVPRRDFANAVALNSIVLRTSTIIGPMVAGLLIARGGLALTYGLNAVSFLAVIAALLAMRPTPPTPADPGEAPPQVSVAALKEGLAFVRGTPILLWTILLDFLATFFSSANALLPIFARDILHAGARGYGVLAGAEASGALAAGALLSVLPPLRRQGMTVLWSVVAYGLATVLFGASRLFWLSWLALAATGVADSISTVLRQTIRQLVTPDRLRGRMTAVNMIFFMGGPQLGELEAGAVATWLGAPWSVITGGIGCLLAAAWVAARGATLRDYLGPDSTDKEPHTA